MTQQMKLVAAVFTTSDGELVTVGDSPVGWAAEVSDGMVAPWTTVTFAGDDIEWLLGLLESCVDHSYDEDRAHLTQSIHATRSVKVEAERRFEELRAFAEARV